MFFVFSWNPIAYHHAFVLEGFQLDYDFAEIHSLHLILPIGMTLSSILLWILGYQWYVKQTYPLQENSFLNRLSLNQGYLNEIYQRVIIQPVVSFSNGLYWFDRNIIDGIVNASGSVVRGLGQASAWIDRNIVDGFVNGIAGSTYYLGHLLRWVQNGRLQNYLGFAFTVLLIGLLYLILK